MTNQKSVNEISYMYELMKDFLYTLSKNPQWFIFDSMQVEDTKFFVDSDKKYNGCRFFITLHSPFIYVDTTRHQIVGIARDDNEYTLEIPEYVVNQIDDIMSDIYQITNADEYDEDIYDDDDDDDDNM